MTCFISGEECAFSKECEFIGNCELTGCEIDAAACPDSPDGKHHCGPVGSDEDLMGSGDECYYCGEIS